MREYRVGNFQMLPLIIKNLLIINVLVYLAQSVLPVTVGNWMTDMFALHSWQSPLFKPWQPLTYMFMHGSWGHIFGNMFALWMFGAVLENLWGPKRFLIFYLVCGLGATFFYLIYLYFQMGGMVRDFATLKANYSIDTFLDFIHKYHIGQNNPQLTPFINAYQANPTDSHLAQNAIQLCNSYYRMVIDNPTVGASGAIFGVLVAFGYLFPNTLLYIYFLFPIKAKWVIIGYILVELALSIQNSAGDNIAHVAHLGGGLIGFLLVYYWSKRNRRDFY